jgi:hypothetical protein
MGWLFSCVSDAHLVPGDFRRNYRAIRCYDHAVKKANAAVAIVSIDGRCRGLTILQIHPHHYRQLAGAAVTDISKLCLPHRRNVNLRRVMSQVHRMHFDPASASV